MMLRECLDTWFLRTNLTGATYKRYVYELAMFTKHNGPLTTDITSEQHDQWRQSAMAGGLSPRTIESVLSSVRTLCRFAGNILPIGQRLRTIRTIRHTPTFAEFCLAIDSATWHSGKSATWWRRWLCWAYCTGLRRGDLLRLTNECVRGECVELIVAKTGKAQTIPIPARLAYDGGRFLHVGIKQLRHALRSFCGSAGVKPFTPHAIRRLSAKEWERAHAGCGAVILGHAIPGWSAATASYLDGSDLLRLGLPRLRLPAVIADPEREQRTTEIVSLASRLPDAEQSAAVSVLRAMAR